MKPKKTTQIRVFVRRIVTSILVFLILDFAVGTLLRIIYYSQENKYTYGLLETHADIIIVGSSRAQHHYVPSIFSDSLELSCLNMGSGGQNIYFHYAVIKSILDRYAPKLILLDLMNIDYSQTDETHNTEKLSILLPYYNNCTGVEEVIRLRSPWEKYKMLLKSYPYNSQISNILYAHIKKGRNPNLIMQGYIPTKGNMDSTIFINDKGAVYPVDLRKVEYIEKTIAICKQKNVELIILISPMFINANSNAIEDTLLEGIALKNGIEIWSYKSDRQFINNRYYFKDNMHLNEDGSEAYSAKLAHRIKYYFADHEISYKSRHSSH